MLTVYSHWKKNGGNYSDKHSTISQWYSENAHSSEIYLRIFKRLHISQNVKWAVSLIQQFFPNKPSNNIA